MLLRGLPQSVQANTRKLSRISLRPPPTTSFPIHYSFKQHIILLSTHSLRY